ncbi:unnamed protein product, partial [Symbiodinium necroappetens]
MQSLNPGHGPATTAWAHSAFNKKDRILLDAISKEVMQRLYEIEPQSLGILADAQLGCQPQLEQALRPFAQRFADLMPRGLDDSTMTTFMQLVREIRVDNFGAWGTRHVFQQMGLASPTQDFLDRAQGEILQAGAAVGADEGAVAAVAETTGLVHAGDAKVHMVFHAAELMRFSVAGLMEDSELLKALRGAKPGWTQQDLVAVQRKLTKVGIRSPEELSSSLSSLNELLQGAGFLKFSADTLQALRERLPQIDSGTQPSLFDLQQGWHHPRNGYPAGGFGRTKGAMGGKVGFGGPNPNSVFKHAQQKEAPLCEDNLWK